MDFIMLTMAGMDGPTPQQIVEEFYFYRMSIRDTLGEFLAHYHRLYLEASDHGVLGVDGIFHLLVLLPSEWREWAVTLVPQYVDRATFSDNLYGDCRGFIATLSHQYLNVGIPPLGPHEIPHDYVALRLVVDPVFRANPILFAQELDPGDSVPETDAMVRDLENDPIYESVHEQEAELDHRTPSVIFPSSDGEEQRVDDAIDDVEAMEEAEEYKQYDAEREQYDEEEEEDPSEDEPN